MEKLLADDQFYKGHRSRMRAKLLAHGQRIFDTYELLAYLSVRANQLKMKTCEIPVTREYPRDEETPTKIKGIKGNYNLFKILILNMFGKYKPKKVRQ